MLAKTVENINDDLGPLPFSLCEYLQLAGLTKRSIVLTVSCSHKHVGSIGIQDGFVVWAEDDLGQTGLTSLRHLIELNDVLIECSTDLAAYEQQKCTRNIFGTPEQLLLEIARIDDENKRCDSTLANEAYSSPVGEKQMESITPMSNNDHLPKVPPLYPSIGPTDLRQNRLGNNSSRDNLNLVHLQQAPAGWAREETVTNEDDEGHVMVTMPQPLKLSQDIDKVTSQSVPLVAAARSDRDGVLLESTGDFDAETACAVATLASHHIEDLANEFGLGEPTSWCIGMGDKTWYVIPTSDELLICVGENVKNPISNVKKIEKSVRKPT